MKKVLIDLNVLLDFLAKRKNHESAASIIALCEKRAIKGHIASHEVTTLAYFLSDKYKNKSGYKNILNDILDLLSTISVNETMLRKALTSKVTDYEDAVIEQAALKEGLDYIITNNISDFKKAEIKPITPREYLTLFIKSK